LILNFRLSEREFKNRNRIIAFIFDSFNRKSAIENPKFPGYPSISLGAPCVTTRFGQDTGELAHRESESRDRVRPLGKSTFGRKDPYAIAEAGSDAERLLHRAATDRCHVACAGAERPGDSGRGSLPKAYFTAISHAETELRKISLSGSANISRASSENSGAALTANRNVAVSNNTLTVARH
jgi:hypothetical protein